MQKLDKNHCTACGACANICQKNAIQMKEDKQGFLYPSIDEEKCINCHLCEKVCQNIDTLSKNSPSKTLALQSKDYSLSQKSSSGGMFAQIAKYVLSKNGIVFGCTMEKTQDNFEIKHIYIDNEKDLYKLQGSKYVQSDIKNTYKESKQFLEQNRLVLYSGTPCQIAGLKSFLQKEYSNLICIDLSCEGVPSQKLFNDYIKFLEKEKFFPEIIDFKFRNKQKFGWSTQGFTILCKDKKNKLKEKTIFQLTSSYFNLFINGGIHRESCYNCQFTGLNRLSDVTIADCWGIEFEYPNLLKNSLTKNRGISLVLINTQKGEEILEKIKENLVIENIDITKLKKYNGPLRYPIKLNDTSRKYLPVYEKFGYKEMDKLFKKNLGWKYFYYKIKEHTPKFVKNIIKFFMHKPTAKSDCLLMTWFAGINYGSILTAYALKESIKKLGFSTKYINNGIPISYAKEFNKKYAEKTDLCLVNKDFENLNKLSDIFIVGADNQLDFSCVNERIYQNLLDFAGSSSKKMIISGSFGAWNFEEEPEVMQNLELLFKRFDFISTREDFPKQKLKEKFNIDAEWFMDPVFFLEKQDYEKLIENTKTNDYQNSIMSYVLYPNEETKKTTKYLQEKYNLKVNQFFGNQLALSSKMNDKHSVENWLKSIRDSKFIVTDSFHCVSFAIIFNRPVICLKNSCDTTRFSSIFKKLNLPIPIYTSYQDFFENFDNRPNIDYEVVNQNLNIQRNQILTKIKEELCKEKQQKKEIEEQFTKLKEQYYKLHPDFYYKRNRFFYLYFIRPFILPIVNKIKKDKFKKALKHEQN